MLTISHYLYACTISYRKPFISNYHAYYQVSYFQLLWKLSYNNRYEQHFFFRRKSRLQALLHVIGCSISKWKIWKNNTWPCIVVYSAWAWWRRSFRECYIDMMTQIVSGILYRYDDKDRFVNVISIWWQRSCRECYIDMMTKIVSWMLYRYDDRDHLVNVISIWWQRSYRECYIDMMKKIVLWMLYRYDDTDRFVNVISIWWQRSFRECYIDMMTKIVSWSYIDMMTKIVSWMLYRYDDKDRFVNVISIWWDRSFHVSFKACWTSNDSCVRFVFILHETRRTEIMSTCIGKTAFFRLPTVVTGAAPGSKVRIGPQKTRVVCFLLLSAQTIRKPESQGRSWSDY